MATKAGGVKCYDKAEPHEEIFVLRAQDLSSPLVVLEWIKLNIEMEDHEKLRAAFNCALEMTKWGRIGTRKAAD